MKVVENWIWPTTRVVLAESFITVTYRERDQKDCSVLYCFLLLEMGRKAGLS